MSLFTKLIAKGVPCKANDNIADHLTAADRKEMQKNVETSVQMLMKALCIDTENDHNTRETAQRVAKMFTQEIWSGRYEKAPKVTEFTNAQALDELYVSGPMTVRSTCSHHLLPIMGQAWIGVLPTDKVLGLSKFNRIVDWFAQRPQIQEELTMQIAKYLEAKLKPRGIGVIIKAEHFCMKCRGVKEPGGLMTTSVMLGEMRESPRLKSEFLDLIHLSLK